MCNEKEKIVLLLLQLKQFVSQKGSNRSVGDLTTEWCSHISHKADYLFEGDGPRLSNKVFKNELQLCSLSYCDGQGGVGMFYALKTNANISKENKTQQQDFDFTVNRLPLRQTPKRCQDLLDDICVQDVLKSTSF